MGGDFSRWLDGSDAINLLGARSNRMSFLGRNLENESLTPFPLFS